MHNTAPEKIIPMLTSSNVLEDMLEFDVSAKLAEFVAF